MLRKNHMATVTCYRPSLSSKKLPVVVTYFFTLTEYYVDPADMILIEIR